MTRDEYDPRICFDDIYGDAAVTPHGDPIHAARSIIRRARRRRLHSPSIVLGCGVDMTRSSFAVGGFYEIIGDDAPPIDLPVYGALYKQFADGLPEPRTARVDDEASYAAFRADRGSKYLDAIVQRLSALEDAFAQHVADHHGGGRIEALEEALRQHITQCRCGGDPIPLPVPGEIAESWQDGAEILCTVRFCGPDGQTKMITSGTPAERAVNEVVGCAIEEDVEPEDLAQVAAPVAQVLGASSLVQQLCGVVQDVIDCGAGSTISLIPSIDPALCAAMMLLQRCQAGDWPAMQDARRMSRDKSSKKLLDDAGGQLTMAQTAKAGGLS